MTHPHFSKHNDCVSSYPGIAGVGYLAQFCANMR